MKNYTLAISTVKYYFKGPPQNQNYQKLKDSFIVYMGSKNEKILIDQGENFSEKFPEN